MTEPGRGAAIDERLKALGVSDREFEDQTGINRKTLRRAAANDEKVRASTYAAIEAALDKLERRASPDLGQPRSIGDAGDDLVEFTIEGNFGVRAVVKGPIRDMEALQAAVAKLVRDMQGPSQNS